MNPMQNLVDFTIDAIVASGKKFDNISKDAIVNFLTNTQNVTNKEAEKVYKKVSEIISGKTDLKPQTLQTSSVHHEEPLKQKPPRKSVFSEIKKITK